MLRYLICVVLALAACDAADQCIKSDSFTISKKAGGCAVSATTPTDPYRYCMPNIKDDCSKSENKDCLHCILYFEAVDKGGVCQDSHAGPNKYCNTVSQATTIQIATAEAGKTPHWKVVPTTPIRGTEEVKSTPNVYDKVWVEGWKAAEAKNLPYNGVAVPSFTYGPAMVINSAHTRRDHQMHIHIANIKKQFLDELDKQKISKFDTTWHVVEQDKIIMMCPPATAQLQPFSAMHTAIASKHWTVADPWHHTTVAVVKPSFCKGGTTCEFCQLLLDNIGDPKILYY